jgi:spermidine synthase
VLVLEILGVRLLAPYVGLTLETTTSIIGVVLGAIAAGSALGGRAADRVDPRLLLTGLLIAGGVLALLTAPLVRLMSGAPGLVAAGIALVPPAAVLSAVTPTVARLQLSDLERSGTVVGRLSAWATAGALAGTFGTGFVLVPLLSVTTSLLIAGGLLIVTGLSFGAYAGVVGGGRAATVVLLAAGAVGVLVAVSSPCEVESDYHCATVSSDPARENGRVLTLDDLRHSYVDLQDPRHLEFEYVRWLADSIDGLRPGPLDVVFAGGGGFTLPRWLLAERPGSRARVLEVDPDVIALARRRLGLRTSRALRVTTGDARVTLRRVPTSSADVVVGDAFGTAAVPWHLATSEWMRDVKRVLRPGGLYALNVIDRGELRLFRAEAATLLREFRDVRAVALPGPAEGNLVLLASDQPLPHAVGSTARGARTFDRRAVGRLAGNAEPLRDDSAPADQLLGTSG